VLRRPKQGFGAPVWRWSDSLRAIAEEELFRPPILEHLDEAALRELIDSPASTRQGFEVWTVLNFALWHRHWVEGDDLREAPWASPAAVPT
jgi:asparagine synthase (glutamine-hydrolysing)